MQSSWTWSAEHDDYYFLVYDTAGQPNYIWAKQRTAGSACCTQESFSEIQTVVDPGNSTDLDPKPADSGEDRMVRRCSYMLIRYRVVPFEVRQRQPNFIAGNPEAGWYDALDSSYRMRTGKESREFFKLGRVFSMLYTETASGTERLDPNDDAFTIVRFGSMAHTQIRRFVVVNVRRNFVHAWNQGTFKRGCDPSEHALVYNQGVDPATCYFVGEVERGLTKEPIQVVAADSTTFLTRESRIRFGKIYSIEWNVRVKDIGRVVDEDLSTLVAHHNAETLKWDAGF
ncbi:hypothetical protein C7974DRAFT_371295 [Boeremia exigua]|uniref:uncharacterized protein n=1 Tax=Boeremia exigua TaxID=749465 RepID=UPI001E8CC27C|nr:uncharacterized protein C7974DRAFT_371295 [Boeremia exigua]KAH6644149.1 hypothetical protein C7974DRAFT_371295 [Boeremia exigua]